MRVAIITSTTPGTNTKDSVPDGGFVVLINAGSPDAGLKQRLTEIKPHIVTIDSPSQEIIALVRHAVSEVRAELNYPLPLLIMGAGYHSSEHEIVEFQPAGDGSNVASRAAKTFASVASPRVLFIDDVSNEIPPWDPFQDGVWLVPIIFRTGWYAPGNKETPPSWQLPDRRSALEQLLSLARDPNRPVLAMLDIKLHDPLVAVGVAVALLLATNAEIQPISGYEQQPAFASRAGWLSQLFEDRLFRSRSRTDFVGVVGSKLLDEVKRTRWASAPAESADLEVELVRDHAQLATLSWFEWRMPWELVGQGSHRTWRFKLRSSRGSRPEMGYNWEQVLLSDRSVPSGWIESGLPQLLSPKTRSNYAVLPQQYLSNDRFSLLRIMADCLNSAPDNASILDLAKHERSKEWIEWVHKRMETKDDCSLALPLDTILRRIKKFGSKHPIDHLGTQTQRAVDNAVRDSCALLGLGKGVVYSHLPTYDCIVFILLAVQELFRCAQASTKQPSANIAARRLLFLFEELRKSRVVLWGSIIQIEAEGVLTSSEIEALRADGKLHIQLLVALALGLI